ncbi:putative clathrin assembly protein At1g03050 [Magnolia sinica]|uniref:putative clathrin assembly protein At1g03050 n=1 Tax=Magnolia sinica TaxID=86752 RepID=UPI00265A0DB9|nr:putative clathrin assembly protein At1g03050 [Magnolia sinica]
MGPSKIRKALGAVKDKTSIGLAKVGSSNSIADLEVAIVKATRHEEYPAEERHVREILSLTCYSRAYVSACVSTLSRRLNKTQNWTVALKTLMLVHRLLSEGDPAYEQEIFFSTRRGTRLLNLSDFRDTSRSDSWDFSAFVRTFALYLDERLEFRMQGRHSRHRISLGGNGDDDDDDDETASRSSSVRATPVRDMKIERIFTRMQHLQLLLERFLACRPTGAAKMNRVVTVAIYPLVKESFQIYYDITEILGILIDRFMELEVADCVRVFDIFSRVSKQFNELDRFYSWCKTVGISRSSEYPEVERITSKKLEVMEEFIRDKSVLAQRRPKKNYQEQPKKEVIVEEPIEKVEEDMTSMKALPPPENFVEPAAEEEEKEEKKKKNTDEEMDLVNMREDHAVTGIEQSDKMALALFDGELAGPPTTWEAFTDESSDWETALVQSASNLSNQKASFGGGFDMFSLDGMYQRGKTDAEMSGGQSSGSASSMAFLGETPGRLALPPVPHGGAGDGGDPFQASLAIAPPAYVQMSDMEKKQQLLVEEQLLWQQYARDGMQGQLGFAKLQNSPYSPGGQRQGYLR